MPRVTEAQEKDTEPRVPPSGAARGALRPLDEPRWRRYVNDRIAAEVSRLTRYYDRVIQWRPLPADTGRMLDRIDCRVKTVARTLAEIPEPAPGLADRTALLLRGNINHDHDIQRTLIDLRRKLSRTGRIVLVAYNPYFRTIYRWANAVGLRHGEVPDTFVTVTDLRNLAKLAGFEVVRVRPTAHAPRRFLGLGSLLNTIMPAVPVLRWLGLASVVVLRPIEPSRRKPSLSIIVPARNECGNIEDAVRRMPDFGGADIELIFVEGHSTDGTWEEIQRVCRRHADHFDLRGFQQSGKGKVDAVRLGFAEARKELLVILDADLTMPPELLERFYDAYRAGHADFINGSRLVYTMEGKAMRFLNRLGNVFFAKTLSYVLDSRIGDSLCGTKLLSRCDYDRFRAWREDFGDVDPFGDFELLFPAAELGLGIVDIPIRYRDRTYGTTNISRFRHGVILLKMTWIGLTQIKFGSKRR